LDRLLVEKELADSGEKARALIMAGLVTVNGVKAEKAGHAFPSTVVVAVKDHSPPFVSRGGLKLDAALKEFQVEVKDRVFMDVGASTGGFTDCLLQNGARKVFAIDVGYGQFHWKLRQDPRVEILEKTNIRYLKSDFFSEPVQGAVIDVSFISLRLVIPPVSDLLTNQSFILALIKPQFEVGKGKVGKGGVVRDPALHQEVIDGLGMFFEGCGWEVNGTIPSPILGPKGNREFLVYLTR
jgi:23S rRNA (cytidine1920-2'-O)/16S rRNA (cytidine1409-2'-O)-methyltransferase